MSIKAYFFDAGGATMGHGPDRNTVCLSGGVALLGPDGLRIATASYGDKCLRELRPDEVDSLVSALGIGQRDDLLKLAPDAVASAVAELIRKYGIEAGLAPLAAPVRRAR